MPEELEYTPLNVHTLDSLCVELVSGRGVQVDGSAEPFRFGVQDTRAAFNWLYINRRLWSGNNNKADVERLVQALDTLPAAAPPTTVARPTTSGRLLHLLRVRSHRFGGLQRFGTVTSPPPLFELDLQRPLVLIQGLNGSGKSSVANAILWCLTGKVAKSQRPPEQANLRVPIRRVTETAQDDEPVTGGGHEMASITPIPPAEVLENLADAQVPLDTWVELTFVSSDTGEQFDVRRSLQRNARGIANDSVTGIDRLGVDPVAIEVGTVMPAMIPYIQLGATSHLGTAVAALTGLRPLSQLVTYVRKSVQKLRGELPRERQAEIEALDGRWTVAREHLEAVLAEINDPNIAGLTHGPAIPLIPEQELAAIRQDLDALIARLFESARLILGPTFDAGNRTITDALRADLGGAIASLQPGQLGRLPSLARLVGIRSLTMDQMEAVEVAIAKIRREASELAQLLSTPDLAPRVQLYAAVSKWMRQYEHSNGDCPVCDTSLEGKHDFISRRPVRDHLADFAVGDRAFLAMAVAEWVRDAVRRLTESLPVPLRSETSVDLPASPGDLLRVAVDELFADASYRRSLALLKDPITALCAATVAGLPAYTDPTCEALPHLLENEGRELIDAMRRVLRLLAFSRWRHSSDLQWRGAIAVVLGTTGGTPTGTPQDGASESVALPLQTRLMKLDEVVRSANPARQAMSYVGDLDGILRQRREKQAVLASYIRAIAALEPMLGLDTLVEQQVGTLMRRLAVKTDNWKQSLYQPAFTGAPSLRRTDVGSGGELSADAQCEDTIVAAQHVSNASSLRATLLAFLLALWQEIVATRGGLSLLLLDDVHELFDEHNQRNLANAIPKLLTESARPLVTTNRREFRLMVQRACRLEECDGIDCRDVHAINGQRGTVTLTPFLEAVERKQKAFRTAENDAVPARDYVNELRVFLDANLTDFFETRDPLLPATPTLSDLIGALRRRHRAGIGCFTDPPFRDLLCDPALQDGCPFLSVMNRSHHGDAHLITFVDVYQRIPDCDRVCDLLRNAQEHHERWMRRDTGEPVPAMPVPPSALVLPSRALPVIRLAALSDAATEVSGEETGEHLQLGSLANHCVFLLNTDNLGFAAPRHSKVLVDLSGRDVDGNRLVIAIHEGQTFARRLLRDPSRPDLVILASEDPRPLDRVPTRVLPKCEVLVLPIVGVLLGAVRPLVRPHGEAVLVEESSALDGVHLVFRIEQDSAVPLALPGQYVLGGARLLASEFSTHRNRLVAVKAGDLAVFKRIGDAQRGAGHLRLLESIGGRGDSILVRTEEIENDPFRHVPVVSAACLIEGVLYDLPHA